MNSTTRYSRARFRLHVVALVTLTALGVSGAMAQTNAPGTSGARQPDASARSGARKAELARPDQTFNDWKLRCEKVPNTGERCYLFQVLVRQETRDPILHIAIGRSEPGAQPVALLTLPLGVILPPGLTMQIDNGISKQVPWEICARAGCRAAVPLDNSMVQAMKAGAQATIGFVGPDRKQHKLPVSLSGFTAAYAALP